MGLTLAPVEDSLRLGPDGSLAEGSFIVGQSGITDKKGKKEEEDGSTKATKYSLDTLEQKELIGFGSSGRVYRVEQKTTKEIFALKVIPMDTSTKQVRVQLVGEIRAMSRLVHNNIVNCLDAFLVDGVMYILLEFFDCGSLADLLNITGPIPERILASFSKQILSALAFCHGQRYIHRDLKPSNFLVTAKGIVKIADFGTSSHLQGNASAASTWVGTVTYMSPERIKGSEYTFATDIWSFGLTIFEMASKSYPYPPSDCGSSQHTQPAQMGFWELLDLIVQKPAPALDPAKFSKELCDFVAQTLVKDPEHRPPAEKLLQHPFLRASNIAPAPETAAWIRPHVKKIAETISKAATDALNMHQGQ